LSVFINQTVCILAIYLFIFGLIVIKAKVRNIGTTLKLRQASRAQLIHLLTALREKEKQKKDSKL